jgi:signal transduction histidine kinase
VRADPAQIRRVLTNLCCNARDAMPRGGRLRIETANVSLDGEAARDHLDGRPGEYVRVRVRDTGAGIPAEVLPRIFDPFFTTKDVGMGPGLGLAMAFGIVKEHLGWITSRSQLGEGSVFEVYLPRSADPDEGSAGDGANPSDPVLRVCRG